VYSHRHDCHSSNHATIASCCQSVIMFIKTTSIVLLLAACLSSWASALNDVGGNGGTIHSRVQQGEEEDAVEPNFEKAGWVLSEDFDVSCTEVCDDDGGECNVQR
jgi:hypothetical protein